MSYHQSPPIVAQGAVLDEPLGGSAALTPEPAPAKEAAPADTPDKPETLTRADVHHNMKVIIMLDAVFTTGVADLTMVMTPLLVFLGASSTQIGFLGSLGILGLFGTFVSPFISVRYKYKKWYLFVAHLPYIGTWGLIGLGVLFSDVMGSTYQTLLGYVMILSGLNSLFGGFVGLPHQEYTAACIPMSYRGRYSSWSMGIGSVSSLGSTALGGWILHTAEKPMAFGYLFLMAWFFCQLGYVLALFGRERPTPVENAPKPWTPGMFRAVWNDKPFLKLMIANAFYMAIIWPTVLTFLSNYGFKELKMEPELSAVLVMIINVVRIVASGPVGYLTDKLHPKRMLPFWPLVFFVSLLPVIISESRMAVYISTGIGALLILGLGAAFLALIYGLPKPENRSGHYTIQMLQNSLAQAVGPLTIGWMCDALSFRVTFGIIAVVALALAPLFWYLLKDVSADANEYA